MIDSKTCRACGLDFPLSEYYLRKSGKPYPDHKKCYNLRSVETKRKDREKNPEKWTEIWKTQRGRKSARSVKGYNIKSQFGITIEEYDALLELQNHACDICERTDNGNNQYFAIDHNHETGKVRGLLCNQCNSGLGLFGDSPERLLKAAAYLFKN